MGDATMDVGSVEGLSVSTESHGPPDIVHLNSMVLNRMRDGEQVLSQFRYIQDIRENDRFDRTAVHHRSEPHFPHTG